MCIRDRAIAVPITAGRYLNTILRTIENILVPDCLTRYNASKEPVSYTHLIMGKEPNETGKILNAYSTQFR